MGAFTCVREPEENHWVVEITDKIDLAAQIYWTICTVVWANVREELEHRAPWILAQIEH